MVVIATTFFGCAPVPASAPQVSGGGASPHAAGSGSARPRVTIVIGAEVNTLVNRLGGGNTFSAEFHFLLNSPLTLLDPQGLARPLLATSLPSRDNGTWVVNVDGTMQTTYRIRPNALWHDGQPVTSSDIAFAYRVYADPRFPAATREPEQFMERVEPVDEKTFTIHWKQPYPWADELIAGQLAPLPRHVMGSVYDAGDIEAFVNHSFWTSTDYIGEGPFRLVQWDPGSQMIYRAFPDYFMGPPRLDEVVFRIIGDANTVVASVLGGNGDATVGITLGQQGGATVRTQWAQTGEGQVITTPTRWRYTQIQYDPQRNGQPALFDRRVRQAIAHGIDRVSMAEVVTQGTATAADVPLIPGDPLFTRVEQAAMKYAYDPARAAALLQDAGWTRRGDALLSQSGQPFALDVWTTAAADNEREVSIIGADLGKLGMQIATQIIPQSRIREAEYRVSFPGLNNTAQSIDIPNMLSVAISDRCPTPENRFAGGNRGCYRNAEFDRQYLTASTSLDRSERDNALIQALKALTEDVGVISLTYNTENVALRKGLVGPGARWPGQTGNTWNIHEWYWEA